MSINHGAPEQMDEGYTIALGKRIGERVLGIMPPLSEAQIRELPESSHFRLLYALSHDEGESQALHYEEAHGIVVGDMGFQAFADQIAEQFDAKLDHTVRRIGAGSVFDHQAVSRDQLH